MEHVHSSIIESFTEILNQHLQDEEDIAKRVCQGNDELDQTYLADKVYKHMSDTIDPLQDQLPGERLLDVFKDLV